MIRMTRWWALAGLVIPLAWIAFRGDGGLFSSPRLVLLTWPTSWLLWIVQYEEEFTPFGISVYAISIGLNVLLYSILGALVWLAFFRAAR